MHVLLVAFFFLAPEPAGQLKAARRTVQDLTKLDVLKPADGLEHNVTAALGDYRFFAAIFVLSSLGTTFVLCAFLRMNRSTRTMPTRGAALKGDSTQRRNGAEPQQVEFL